MPNPEIRFDDGAAYERYMGKWSQLAGESFLNWIAPQQHLRWLDVGCGNGAFTEMLIQRSAPQSVDGVDPSEAQLAYARSRAGLELARFQTGDAMALPFPPGSFDAAVMPLVIFFVPQPSVGVAEMARVVRPGGLVAAYAWDMTGGGFPYDSLWVEMRAMGLAIPFPPSPDASRIDVMRDLWLSAGLESVETREITVQRSFTGFDDYWATVLGGPSVGPTLKATAPAALDLLRARLRDHLPTDPSGRITYSARANAVKGRIPN